MINFIRIFPFISLFISHPLDQITLDNVNVPFSSVTFLQASQYAAPDDGYVKNIIDVDGFYQMILSLDNGSEVVYSGITESKKKTGECFIKCEHIGIDATITPNTKFILMFYEYSQSYPQFNKNSLTFLINQGLKVYMVANGTIISQGWDFNDAGNYTKIKFEGSNTYVNYWHLLSFTKTASMNLHQGDLIGYSGNTGWSLSPRLAMYIEDAELGDDIRVIYYRGLSNGK